MLETFCKTSDCCPYSALPGLPLPEVPGAELGYGTDPFSCVPATVNGDGFRGYLGQQLLG